MTLCNLGLQKSNEVFIFWRGVPFACLFGVLSLKFVKLFPWGCVSAPAGVAPEALEEWEHSSKGYEHRVCTVDWIAGLLSFVSAGLGIISASIGI